MHFHSSPPQRSQRLPPELKKPLFQIIPDKFVLEPYQSQMVTLQGSSPVYVYAALFPGPAHLYTAENGTGLGMRLVDTHINIVIAETGSLCTLSTMTHCVLSNRSSSISLSLLFSSHSSLLPFLVSFLTHLPSSLLPLSSPQVVSERLLCHAIIGRNPHKERIMSVDVSARFIAPLLVFSAQEMLFSVQQVE